MKIQASVKKIVKVRERERERENSVLEKKRDELKDKVWKLEERIKEKFEMLHKRLADEEARGRSMMDEISGLEVKRKKLNDVERLLDKIIIYWLFESTNSDLLCLYLTILFIY